MSKIGRETSLTSETHAVIVDAVSKGLPRKYAAAKAGITPRTLTRWEVRGREGEEPYLSLVSALKKADALYIETHLKTIANASFDTWQAAAWLLERRFPELFSANRHELTQLRKQYAELVKANARGGTAKAAANGEKTATGKRRVGGDKPG